MPRKLLLILVMLCLLWSECAAVPKAHVITFGKWISAKWPNATGQKLLDLKVRPLFVDTRLKEYTTGTPHDVTDRLFVVRRAFRVNDALPTENANASANSNSSAPRWQWQRGGWLLVNRLTGRVSQLNLAEFDPFYSTESWYRDYIAYCGVSEDGKKLYAVVAQIGRRKPILKKEAGEPAGADNPDSECPAPVWERSPMRVTFQPNDKQKLVFSIPGPRDRRSERRGRSGGVAARPNHNPRRDRWAALPQSHERPRKLLCVSRPKAQNCWEWLFSPQQARELRLEDMARLRRHRHGHRRAE